MHHLFIKPRKHRSSGGIKQFSNGFADEEAIESMEQLIPIVQPVIQVRSSPLLSESHLAGLSHVCGPTVFDPTK